MALHLSSRRHRPLLTYQWLDTYTRSRWLVGGLAALILVGLKVGFSLGYPLLPVLAITVIYVALQPLFTILLERYDEVDPTMALVELVVDSLLVTALIYWTGGIQSPFHWLWIGLVMLAALTGGRKASLVMAVAITLVSGLELGLEVWGLLPSQAAGGPSRPAPGAIGRSYTWRWTRSASSWRATSRGSWSSPRRSRPGAWGGWSRSSAARS